jgi:hypothetical protein
VISSVFITRTKTVFIFTHFYIILSTDPLPGEHHAPNSTERIDS